MSDQRVHVDPLVNPAHAPHLPPSWRLAPSTCGQCAARLHCCSQGRGRGATGHGEPGEGEEGRGSGQTRSSGRHWHAMTKAELERHLADPSPNVSAYARAIDPDVPLDRWISFAVKVLREAGVSTYESCQGGPGHSYAEPAVRFHGTNAEGYRAVTATLNYGLPVSALRRVWFINRGDELDGPTWEITFWPGARLRRRQRAAEDAGYLVSLEPIQPWAYRGPRTSGSVVAPPAPPSPAPSAPAESPSPPRTRRHRGTPARRRRPDPRRRRSIRPS